MLQHVRSGVVPGGDRPKWMRAQRYVTGALLAGFGLRIAVI
ncbi:hypothetical protein NKH18_32865 [Streptomyces sp. M10(2022)]